MGLLFIISRAKKDDLGFFFFILSQRQGQIEKITNSISCTYTISLKKISCVRGLIKAENVLVVAGAVRRNGTEMGTKTYDWV